MDFTKEMRTKQDLINKFLKQLFESKSNIPQILSDSINYSLFAGGKRLRPILCLAAYDIINGNNHHAVYPIACALECIHTYSLIHDDLPAMDNDDYRRGKLSNHKVYGDGIAILAGDGLLTYGFELLSDMFKNCQNSYKIIGQIINEIAEAAGISGMVGGQVVDLQSEGKIANESTMEYIHRHKTAALIKVSVRSGALLAGANKTQLNALTIYGENLGLAFQIMDDLLDVIGDAQLLGKKTGNDKEREKMTYISLLGVDGTRALAHNKINIAKNAISEFDNAEFLWELADFVVNREY